jgi:hypothetical protein
MNETSSITRHWFEVQWRSQTYRRGEWCDSTTDDITFTQHGFHNRLSSDRCHALSGSFGGIKYDDVVAAMHDLNLAVKDMAYTPNARHVKYDYRVIEKAVTITEMEHLLIAGRALADSRQPSAAGDEKAVTT